MGDFKPQELDYKTLTYHMTGRRVEYPRYQRTVHEDIPLLEVKNLSRKGNFENISFKLYPGDIVGLIGLLGSGRTELALTLFGLNPPDSGEIIIKGKGVKIYSPTDARQMGIGLLPEDRQTKGLFLKKSVEDNISVTLLEKITSKLSIIRKKSQRAISTEAVKNMRIVVPDVETMVQSLSGGNQQKVIVARELSRPIHLLVAAQPTRGLDVGSIEYIHSQILKRRDEGVAVLLVSTELDEIMQLSDRIAVMYRGKITATVSAEEATKELIGLLMAGVPLEDARLQIQNKATQSEQFGGAN